MNSAPAELLKSYVQSQTFTSTTEVMVAMKEMFRDVIQQVMESELEEELGYPRFSTQTLRNPHLSEKDSKYLSLKMNPPY